MLPAICGTPWNSCPTMKKNEARFPRHVRRAALTHWAIHSFLSRSASAFFPDNGLNQMCSDCEISRTVSTSLKLKWWMLFWQTVNLHCNVGSVCLISRTVNGTVGIKLHPQLNELARKRVRTFSPNNCTLRHPGSFEVTEKKPHYSQGPHGGFSPRRSLMAVKRKKASRLQDAE